MCSISAICSRAFRSRRALDAGAAKLLEAMVPTGANTHVIGWAYNFGARSVLCQTSVKEPADLAGKKIRTLPDPVSPSACDRWARRSHALAFGEIYTVLQAGVLAGLEHDPPTILASKFYETARTTR